MLEEENQLFKAKAAADSYMLNLNKLDKDYLMKDRKKYIKEYLKIFNIAMEELDNDKKNNIDQNEISKVK